MIPGNSTNFLYLANTLPKKYPKFYKEFEKILKECNIDFGLLPNTKDVWAVDYMPIQVGDDHFVQFVYNPDYLQTKKYLKTISDVDGICKEIGITPVKSNIALDGGNVIRSANKVIMTEKIFKENPEIEDAQLIKELRNLFEVDKLFFVPQDPGDYTGHADGMVRFVNKNTVLVNDYHPDYKPKFQQSLRMALHNAGFESIKIPYAPDLSSRDSAKGCYMNYLQMKDVVVIPTFGIEEDDAAIKQLEQIFQGHAIKTIDGNDLAANGGVLNCISWNIRKEK